MLCMKSPLLALLLVFSLLACPVRCLSFETQSAVMGEECDPVGCSCCEHGDKVPASETPQPCSDDCNCQNCICDGAVFEASAELSVARDQRVVWIERISLASPASDTAGHFYSRRCFAAGGQFLCGRDMRVAYQVWLI